MPGGLGLFSRADGMPHPHVLFPLGKDESPGLLSGGTSFMQWLGDRHQLGSAIEMVDGVLFYLPGFLTRERADAALALLQAELDWEQHEIQIFGKQLPCPRLSAWYGDADAGYRYSGLSLSPLPWHGLLAELKQQLLEVSGQAFNSVLANLYRDGSDSMGWHADNEPELGQNPVIASISLGAERRFLLRHRRKKAAEPQELLLQHGSLLVMAGTTQHYWRHSLPKTARAMGPRINLTFRKILG